MGYTCPLCGQPVSPSLYRKITGIWEERQRLLREIKKRRTELAQKLAEEKAKLRKKRAEFRKQRDELIKKAVDRRTRGLESQITALRLKEERMKEKIRQRMEALRLRGVQIEKQAQEKLRKATAQAHSQARKLEEARFKSLEKELRASVRDHIKRERKRIKDQLKKARESGALREKRKYERLERSFRSTLTQMKTMERDLREREARIRELEKQLERETTPQIEGLLYEEKLAEELKKRFSEDDIKHTGRGGDVLQNVIRDEERAGLIVYECKRVKHYSAKHVKQAAEAKKKRNADFAILVTNAMKKGTQGFFVEKGVIVVHAAGVLSVAKILREHIVQIAGMKLGRAQRDEAIKRTLDYLEGPEFSNSMDSIIQESISVYEKLRDEIKKHVTIWKERYEAYKKIYQEATAVKSTSKDLLSGVPRPKIQKVTLPVPVELPKTEERLEKKKLRLFKVKLAGYEYTVRAESEDEAIKLAREEHERLEKLEPKVPAASAGKKKPLGVAVVTTGDESVKEL